MINGKSNQGGILSNVKGKKDLWTQKEEYML